MSTAQQHGPGHEATEPTEVDVVVVGAGFAGMYMLHRLRGLGLSAKVIEAGTDVGGTWYWNRYPGARCDVPSMEYSFSFDKDLEQEWEWTELMSAQPEILEYARHVADRFDLRDDIVFETRVVAADFDEATDHWMVETDGGDMFRSQWCVMATGCLSVVNVPDLPGLDEFEGQLLHTGMWPKEDPDLSGLRVGVIGTGSSGVQAIPELAEQSGHLHVFQRSPVYTVPANNRPLDPDYVAAFKSRYDQIRDRQRTSVTGFLGPLALREPKPKKEGSPRKRKPGLLDLSPEEQQAAFDKYGVGAYQSFRDVYVDPEANAVACDLYREQLRRLIDDPEVADGLEPKNYPLACKRQVLDTDYYPTFNRDDVTLVDLRKAPLEEITTKGVRTSAGEVELDVLILATGFDAMTGALEKIDIRGRDGVVLRDTWTDGPRTYLGLQVAGFPNLFTITGPGSPSVLSNMIVAIEQHVEFIADCIDHLREGGYTTIETTVAAVDEWVEHVNEVAEGTMYTAPDCNSWYLGSNIEGKTRVFMPYVGGFGRYRQRCQEVVDEDYAGFELTTAG